MRLTPVQNPPELTSSKTPLRLKTAPFLHLVSALLTSNLLFSVLASSGLFAATAPDSIAGKVYRDSFFSTAQRMYGEATILFGSDSRFVYLKAQTAARRWPVYLRTNRRKRWNDRAQLRPWNKFYDEPELHNRIDWPDGPIPVGQRQTI